MILIAPDKFKGTLTAQQAASIIADALPEYFCLKAPMADGGEGTARALATQNMAQWEARDGYFVHTPSRTAAIDSSAWIGLDYARKAGGVMKATSAPLGLKVREILKGGCEKVIIGVGGTGTCDGGVGFLQALGTDHLRTYADRLIGLCDVQVPLLSDMQGNDTLMFARQKGATEDDIPLLRQVLQNAQRDWGNGRQSPFDGAGGGLGFAIASAIGAPCYLGAQYVLDNYQINWNLVEAVITGEGKIDLQTLQGKVVYTVCRAAHEHGVPAIAIGGTVDLTLSNPSLFGAQTISTISLNRPETMPADERLRLTVHEDVKYCLSLL